MASADILFSAELEVGTLSPFIDLPSGAATGYFLSDGSFEVEIEDSNDEYRGDGSVKVGWSFGLMKGVDEEHLYLTVAPMVYAKVIDSYDTKVVEDWLNRFHEK